MEEIKSRVQQYTDGLITDDEFLRFVATEIIRNMDEKELTKTFALNLAHQLED